MDGAGLGEQKTLVDKGKSFSLSPKRSENCADSNRAANVLERNQGKGCRQFTAGSSGELLRGIEQQAAEGATTLQFFGQGGVTGRYRETWRQGLPAHH